MRIIDVIQGSEAWEQIRKGLPTASNFSRIVTPARGQLSSAWTGYAATLMAELSGAVVPMMPTQWMDWGTEQEPYAVAAYEKLTGLKTEVVGFVFPDDHGRYGCSPDRLVAHDGLLEVKCPKPETLVEYHVNGEFPGEYRPQVQGQLYITNREWCDFFVYHPQLKPFLIRVERDEKYIANLAVALEEFCDNLDALREKHADIDQAVEVQLNEDYQPVSYPVSEGMSL